MIIDNGTQVPLSITGVFDGLCGMQGGVLSFQPNIRKREPTVARVGVLDGVDVRLNIRRSPQNRDFYVATFGPIE